MTQQALDYLFESRKRRNRIIAENSRREMFIASVIAAFFSGVMVTIIALKIAGLV